MKKSQLHNICHSKELRVKGSFCRAREDQTRKTTPAAAIRLVSNHSLDAVVGFAVAGGYVAEDSRGREGRGDSDRRRERQQDEEEEEEEEASAVWLRSGLWSR